MYKRSGLFAIVGVLLAASLTFAVLQTKNSKDAPPPVWRINYHEAGGLDGRVLFLTLTPDGKVDAKGGLSTAAWESVFQIPAEQLVEVQSIVEEFKLSGTPKPRTLSSPIPDMIYVTLDVVKNGKAYPIEPPPPKLVAILRDLLKKGKKQAEDEKWHKAGDFRLGRVWHVSEEVRDQEGRWHGELWEGTWTRKGDGKTFDAVWRNNQTHQEVRDTVELDSAERGWIMLHRTSSNISYKGYYEADKQNDLVGYVSSCPTCSWRTQIEY